MKEIKSILACVRNADKKYNLINPNDHIAVGISGGKDSMVLFYALHLYSKFNFKNFKIIPIILDLGFDNFDPSKISEFIAKLGYNLIVYEAKDVYKILKMNQSDLKHLPCSICSKMKKSIINKAAKEYKCNKVAFAHHVDDALETLLMNAIYGGKIDTFSPKMYLSKDKMTFIRPLCLASEKSIIKCVKECNIPILKSTCPADHFTERETIKVMLNNLYHDYHMAHKNFINALDSIDNFYLWQEDNVSTIEGTNLYLKRCINSHDFIDLISLLNKSKKSCNLKQIYTYYNVYKKDKIIGYFALNEQDNKCIILEKYYIKDSKLNQIILKEIEQNVFRKYNPCKFMIPSRLKSYLSNYQEENKTYCSKKL